ncbi:phosphoglycerate mutase-like protein [Agrocybe pediades]|nr:phosphoglycerate mutase-like protein [Agrocybe pediades]
MLTVTFIRHGESEDNLRIVWAGWKDSPLSALGRKQADALGKAFASVPITHIYTSPLLRALETAQAVHQHQPDPKPPLEHKPDLREQFFGVAEGKPWIINRPDGVSLEELHKQDIYPVLYGRDQKFPEGESVNDLAARADRAIKDCVLPHLTSGDEEAHIALASHGLCIGELVSALIRLDPEADRNRTYTGLFNTAWTRATVQIRDGQGPNDPNNPPALKVTVTHINNKDHLKSLNEEPHIDAGGASAEARAFFGGEKLKA